MRQGGIVEPLRRAWHRPVTGDLNAAEALGYYLVQVGTFLWLRCPTRGRCSEAYGEFAGYRVEFKR